MPIHPLTRTLPPVRPKALEALANDLLICGQRVPICLANGYVIDGRSRLEALTLYRHANIPFTFKTVDLRSMYEPAVYAIIGYLAIQSKSLTTMQRAELASRIRLFHKESKIQTETIAQTALRYGISKRTLEYCWQRMGGSRKQYRRLRKPAEAASIPSVQSLPSTDLEDLEELESPFRFRVHPTVNAANSTSQP